MRLWPVVFLAAAIACAGAAAGCSGDDHRVEPPPVVEAPTTPSGPVPWSPATVSAVEASPRSPTPAPTPVDTTSLPLCRADQLKVSANWQGATGGAMVGGLTFQNTGTEPCSLAGTPGLALFDENGSTMREYAASTGGPAVFLSGAIPGLPEESSNYYKANSSLGWSGNSDVCRDRMPPVARVVLVVPNGGDIELPQMAGIRPCDSKVGLGAIKQAKLKEPYSLRPEITPHVIAPAQVRAGEAFRYVVALENESDFGLVFGPECPAYRQRIVADRLKRTQATVADGEMRVLNCSGLFRIARGETVEFEMLLEVPAGLAPGQYFLEFDLDDRASSYVGSGGGKIEVVP